MKHGFSKFVWGGFLLVAAAVVVVNQLDGFAKVGIGSVVVAILALAFIVQCLMSLSIAPLPVPLAVLYIVFHDTAGLPHIQTWALLLASVLAWIGLGILLPRKPWGCRVYTNINGKCQDKPRGKNPSSHIRTESVCDDNNPAISVNFSGVSRRIRADRLESVRLNCNFGAMEIFFDEAEISPDGAEAELNCSFGAIKLNIPKHWRVIDNLDCTLGGIDIGKRSAIPAETAPQLTLSGSVSMGGVEVRYL